MWRQVVDPRDKPKDDSRCGCPKDDSRTGCPRMTLIYATLHGSD
jgi:hypothetical protein